MLGSSAGCTSTTHFTGGFCNMRQPLGSILVPWELGRLVTVWLSRIFLFLSPFTSLSPESGTAPHSRLSLAGAVIQSPPKSSRSLHTTRPKSHILRSHPIALKTYNYRTFFFSSYLLTLPTQTCNGFKSHTREGEETSWVRAVASADARAPAHDTIGAY
jgi:hypothetical protein